MITDLQATRSTEPDTSEDIALTWKHSGPAADLIVVDWEGDEDDGRKVINGGDLMFTIEGVDPTELYTISVGEYHLESTPARVKSGPGAS